MYKNQPLSNNIRSTRFICHVVEWCWNHSVRRLALLGCADIILSNNSYCSVVPTSFYPTTHAVGSCWHHFIWQLILFSGAHIILSNISCCWVVLTSFYLTICIKIHFDVLCDSRQHNAPYYSNVPSISTHMWTVQCNAVNKVIGTVHYTSNLNELSEPKGSD